MKKNIQLVLLTSFVSILLLSACSLGFEPAWKAKDGNAVISLQFKAIAAPAGLSSDRAVIQGAGFLYIRTFGGPTGDKGPFYGPFSVNAGQKFETGDIPPGAYSNIGIIFSADNLDDMLFKFPTDSTQYTFRQMMQLSDAALLPLFGNGTDGPSPVSPVTIEDGSVSLGLSSITTIKGGATNNISVTLIPKTGTNIDLSTSQSCTLTPSVSGSIVRKFIRLDNVAASLPTGSTITDLQCVAIPTGGAALLKNIALYDSNGNYMPYQSQVTGETNPTYKTKYTSGTTFYLYVEYQAEKLELTFSTLYTSPNFGVSISGATSYIGKTVYFGLFTTSTPTQGQQPAFGGSFIIASDGTGTVTTTVASGTYFLYGMIDVNGSGSATGPDTGDLGCSGISVTVTETYSVKTLSITDFSAVTTPTTGNFNVYLSGATSYIGKSVNFGLFTTSTPTQGQSPTIGGFFTIASDGTGLSSAKNTVDGSTTIAPGTYWLYAYIDIDNSNSGPASGDPSTGFIQVAVTSTASTKSLTLANFTIPTASGNLTVNFSGGTTEYIGKKLFFGVYSADIFTANGPPSGLPPALGMLTIGADGKGSAVAIDSITQMPFQITLGTVYYLSVFVDINGNYAAVTDTTMATDIYGITPHYGDYATNMPVTVTGSSATAVPLTPANFKMMDSYSYYVSDTGAGTRTGATIANAATLSEAIGYIAATGPASRSTIFLTSDVTVSSSYTILSEVDIDSTNSVWYKLNFASGSSFAPAFTVGSGGKLSMRNIVADATLRTGASTSLIQVNGSGIFYLQSGAIIQNSDISGGNGGAVSLIGDVSNQASFQLYGGLIKGCSADNGGAVYIGENSNMKIEALSSITGNAASVDGGGVFISLQSFIYDPSNTAYSMISGNSAPTNMDIAAHGTIDTTPYTPDTVYKYVSASGNGDGLLSINPCSFETALADTTVSAIVLVSDITLTSAFTINRQLAIVSIDTQYNIYLGGTLSTALFTVGSSGYLQISGVAVGPATAGNFSAKSLVEVQSSGTFMLTGATLRNNSSYPANGGAVLVRSGGSFMIIGASAPAVTSIAGCSASNGAGVYVESTGSFWTDTASGNYSITGNSAVTEGGGIYINAGSMYYDTGTMSTMITGNTAATNANIANYGTLLGTPGY